MTPDSPHLQKLRMSIVSGSNMGPSSDQAKDTLQATLQETIVTDRSKKMTIQESSMIKVIEVASYNEEEIYEPSEASSHSTDYGL